MNLEEYIKVMHEQYPTVGAVLEMLETRVRLEAGSPVGDVERMVEASLAHTALIEVDRFIDRGMDWIVPALRALQAKPTDFTYAEIAALARKIADWFEGDHD